MMTSKTEPRLLCYDLGEGVTAFSTTRHGGVSEANYASFNINPYCGDSADHVALHAHLLELLVDRLDELLDVGVARFLRGVEVVLNHIVGIVLKILQAKVFQLAFKLVQAQFVGKWGI